VGLFIRQSDAALCRLLPTNAVLIVSVGRKQKAKVLFLLKAKDAGL
jgi:hypothetical protein